ncbi:MAG: Gldg family protein [Planctomycetia bacterium]|nr:Gldg family protein [Planctomycetia bacterium]
MNPHALFAIFWRNFKSYFLNPTGYVFLCIFVLLSGAAAFWPAEFFAANLANLDQLNKYLPFIMLIFIPAVTMSIWADERRLGTDELLLTIPASDLDVVLGKYLAAVAIFTASLTFSGVCNFLVLYFLGNPDGGLFVGMYFGYWMVGIAMLAIGMVASFLTNNLTVSFILGAMFNAPLVFLARIDALMPRDLSLPFNLAIDDFTTEVKTWSIAGQFRDFARGVVSLSSISYFLLLTVAMLYVCMVLIGRRHWAGKESASSKTLVRALAAVGAGLAVFIVDLILRWGHAGGTLTHVLTTFLVGVAVGLATYALVYAFSAMPHYSVRFFSICVGGISMVVLCTQLSLRRDVTAEDLNTLSDASLALVKELEKKPPVLVEAFLSPEGSLPEAYVRTRLNLVSTLEELRSQSPTLQVRIYDTDEFSELADRAREQFDIVPRPVQTIERGAVRQDTIIMGVAITSGLDKVVIPFFDRGLPVEYELVRSITAVARVEGEKRKRIGVLRTEAGVMTPGREMTIVTELKKQYDVVEVDPAQPITEKYDCLLAVQPSGLAPQDLPNFIDAIRRGQPTAIFEDPMPQAINARGTGNLGQFTGGMPKGDIRALWDLLGVHFSANDCVWQDYNPFPVLTGIPKEYVFIGRGYGGDPFDEKSPISSRLEQLMFVWPGHVVRETDSKTGLTFTPLVTTARDLSGTVSLNNVFPFYMRLMEDPEERERHYKINDGKYGFNLAAQVRGKLKKDAAMHEGDGPHTHAEAATAGDGEVNVVLVTDIDCLSDFFFDIRARGATEDVSLQIFFDFDNVTFVHSIIDVLAGDNRYIEVRKRRPKHRSLTKIDEAVGAMNRRRQDQIQKITADLKRRIDDINASVETDVAGIRKKLEKEGVNEDERQRREEIVRQHAQQRAVAAEQQWRNEASTEQNKIKRQTEREIQAMQNRYKTWAVALPPILPLLIGIVVFFNRRAGEREGVAASRLR